MRQRPAGDSAGSSTASPAIRCTRRSPTPPSVCSRSPAALAVIGYAGAIPDAAGKGMWLALIGGLIVAVPTATTGFADWVTIEWGTPRWRTATAHLSAMLVAVALFAVAAWLQYDGYRQGSVTTGGLTLSLVGFVALTTGGWLGGSEVFVHGTRVLGRSSDDVPTDDAQPTEVER